VGEKMIWPAMLFNLCVGLLLAGFLLRAVRRYERRADKVMAGLDAAHAEDMRKYDIARDEIRASMRRKVDQAVAELQQMSRISNPTIAANANLVHSGGTISASATTVPEGFVASANLVHSGGTLSAPATSLPPIRDQVPSLEAIRKLPRWAQVAFAARCARRVLPWAKLLWRDVDEQHFLLAIDKAVRVAEQAAADATGTDYDAIYSEELQWASSAASTFATTSEAEWSHAYAFGLSVNAALFAYSATHNTDSAAKSADAALAAARDFGGAVGLIVRDFESVRSLALDHDWTDECPVPPSVFGPLWPEGSPQGWPNPDKSATEVVIKFDVPDDVTTAEAVELAKELAAALCILHLTGGGHGLAIQPPLEITAPACVPVGSSR
jgi:hypothetical protein